MRATVAAGIVTVLLSVPSSRTTTTCVPSGILFVASIVPYTTSEFAAHIHTRVPFWKIAG